MRPLLLLALLCLVACDQKRPAPPPAPVVPPPGAVLPSAPPTKPKPGAGTPCDLSKKPPRPALPDVSNPGACAALGGKWVTKGTKGPAPATSTTALECTAIGRGTQECTRGADGCEGFAWATSDFDKPCDFDWDCQGSCEDSHCSALFLGERHGCGLRCVDGFAKSVCID